ncbi:chemotaxis protein CheX [Cellulomonas sp. URHE0023]|uniref:chemotaxis protein CheX n=1 Tax=Cellulomonas sp. URHE0023 TaxID=1380354 RepID=UPI0004857A8D|nr:chemotaxis protein CheX [Cellulomonas sp. URHE0023]
MSPIVEHAQIFMIAQEVFAAMVDGDAGLLQPWDGDLPALDQAVSSWVDIHGDWLGRAVLTTEKSTADDLARALLDMGADEEVTEPDLVDAFGEIANVIGGNVKSLLPTQGSLGLPTVASVAPLLGGAVVIQELRLAWRGRPLLVAVWEIENTVQEGNHS